jgi:hypothetical protein
MPRKTLHKIDTLKNDFQKLMIKIKENTELLKSKKDSTKKLFYFHEDMKKAGDLLYAEIRRIHE